MVGTRLTCWLRSDRMALWTPHAVTEGLMQIADGGPSLGLQPRESGGLKHPDARIRGGDLSQGLGIGMSKHNYLVVFKSLASLAAMTDICLLPNP